jgi:four helix bundle protein
MDLAVMCYGATSDFPNSERFGLVSQIRRAASSVSANIAEGYGRNSPKEYLQFVGIANGSLNELENHLILAYRLKLISAETVRPIFETTVPLGQMLTRLRQALRRKVS